MSPRGCIVALLLPFAFFGLFFACGGDPSTASEKFDAADRARRDGRFDEALALLREVQKGEVQGEAGESDRFRAALEEAKCLVEAGRAKEGVERFRALFEEFPGSMTGPSGYKNTLAMISALDVAHAPADVMIDLLELAGKKHPAQKEKFAAQVEKLKKKGLTSEQMQRLSSLGYLGGG